MLPETRIYSQRLRVQKVAPLFTSCAAFTGSLTFLSQFPRLQNEES